MNCSRMKAVNKLLYPKSIAVIGASNNIKKTGGRLLSYILKHEYPYEIYPVNPKEEQVQGITCYRSIKDIPKEVDLALVVLPVQLIFSTMEECAAKGIKVISIFSSGFAELGREGEVLQEKLLKKARELDLYICGPNAIGIVNTHQNFYGSFSMSMETPKIPQNGKIAFVSQSGAIGGGLLSRVWSEGIGTSHYISSGNEADLDSADYIAFLADDKNTEVICVYLEGLKDGQKFINALKRAFLNEKPVIIYKNGRTSLGKRSVKSHTGSLAGDHQIYEAVFKQYGVIAVDNLEEMFDVANVILSMKDIRDKNVGVVSTSGGCCTIIADSCIQHGLNVPAFSSETQVKLNQIIPDYGVVQNPFDTTANIINNPKMFRQSMEVLMEDPAIDSIVLMLTTVGEPIASIVAQDIIEISKSSSKSLIVTWLISETLASNAFHLLRKNQIPIFSSPERAINVLNYVTNYYLKKKDLLIEGVF
ncbi:acetate--CoA ligase family protein [Neobacillus mesonae]|uniref:acetate--CoA ligase family protein n=1 Tax=Neobacillus mesonae TaxID=1193713 RepID=UPI00203E2541|nr:CoA-binding protein [Neobacillus mesonae]MCM3567496.1 CoA-binding protein [Neobacillus mesonae]